MAEGARRIAADLLRLTLSQVGSAFSSVERTDAEIATYADAMAAMSTAYLSSVVRS